ncbi:MAG: serine/threonine-protein kinase, partial [Myxococcota bacterium]
MTRKPNREERVSSLIGLTIDSRYRVIEAIGEGGMGWVYRAEHIKLRRQVAIKVLNPEFKTYTDIVERFEREAFAASRLDHPNCVAVSDCGALDDGTVYLVMELVEGVTLADALDANPSGLPVRRALHIARQLMRGLGHAHGAGVIHRDIKPDNILLVANQGEPDFVKLLDFGIAKLVGGAIEEAGGKQLTDAGLTMGTPYYMSPEQALGKSLDGRSDLYAASVVLFEALTGQVPFYDPDKMAVLTMHIDDEVPLFREIAPDAEIPSAVELLVRHGLTKDPAQRIRSADEYASRIDRLIAEIDGVAPPPPSAAVAGGQGLPAPVSGAGSGPAQVPARVEPPADAPAVPHKPADPLQSEPNLLIAAAPSSQPPLHTPPPGPPQGARAEPQVPSFAPLYTPPPGPPGQPVAPSFAQLHTPPPGQPQLPPDPRLSGQMAAIAAPNRTGSHPVASDPGQVVAFGPLHGDPSQHRPTWVINRPMSLDGLRLRWLRMSPVAKLGVLSVPLILFAILALAIGDDQEPEPEPAPVTPVVVPAEPANAEPSQLSTEALALLDSDGPKAALDLLESASIADDPHAKLVLGHAHAALDHSIAAMLAYRESVELAPELAADSRLRENRSLLLDQRDASQVDAAVAVLETAIRVADDREARTELIEIASAHSRMHTRI